MDKRELSETEICDRCITPALEQAGWQKSQIRREYRLTQGRIIVRGQMVARGKQKWADYVLFDYPISLDAFPLCKTYSNLTI